VYIVVGKADYLSPTVAEQAPELLFYCLRLYAFQKKGEKTEKQCGSRKTGEDGEYPEIEEIFHSFMYYNMIVK